MIDETTYARLMTWRRRPKPTVVFAAHLANWEIPALCAACVRVPDIDPLSGARTSERTRCDRRDARALHGHDGGGRARCAAQARRALEKRRHVALLVDQHTTQGVDVVFFGRWAKANRSSCSWRDLTGAKIRGVRVIRKHGRQQFWAE
jgi:KDO2-lipid IV(A) lauroyltransferase